MKHIFPLLFLLLILCGCGAGNRAGEYDLPGETAPEEPTGFYDPDSALESTSGGAVQVYPLNRSDCCGMLPMGRELLLFTGTENTTLIKASGANLYITASTTLDCLITPEDPGVQVSEKGVTFYDRQTGELVFLDTELNEVSRLSLPEGIQGSPVLSADRKSLYYCTDTSLRVLDLETGFHKLLKEMFFEEQTVRALHCGDNVLECSILRDDSEQVTYFFSTQTGETLWETTCELTLTTLGQSYFAAQTDGSYQELLTGTTDIGPYALYFDDVPTTALPLLEMGGVILAAASEDQSAASLHYFDLESGKRTAQLDLPGSSIPWSTHTASDGSCVWLLRYDDTYECDTIYRWDPSLSPTGDERVYVSSRFTFEEPDTEGLVQCQERADALSAAYGVDIRIWTDAISENPTGYALTAEYQVPAIRESLDTLERILPLYPEGFLEEAAKGTFSGRVQLCIVRSIDGSAPTSLDHVPGLQFWNSREDACVCLEAGDTLEQSLYHELFHIIDSRVMSTCSAYDDWDALNPEGFRYDLDYLTNLDREDHALTEGEDRAFIDTYSMSFPREDRARIMEYAMTAGNEDCFTSPIMQQKLRKLCLGIRQAFGLESAQTLPWEQYLSEPIHE